MSKIRLAFIIPSLQSGGMERVMAVLLEYYASKPGLNLHLVLYGVRRDIFYQIPDNITIHRPEFIFDNGKRLLHTWYTLRFLRRKIKELNAHSILSFGEYWNNMVMLAGFGYWAQIVLSDRQRPDKALVGFHEVLRKILYRNARRVIAQTDYAAAVYRAKYGWKNIEVIGNPIREFKLERENEKRKIVLSVGRLISTKHFDRLIRIFAGLEAGDWELHIAGGNALKQNNYAFLSNLTRDLGIENKVKLLGYQNNVTALYQQAQIFAFTSSSEGFPNVIGEAMSAALPVVAYDCFAGPSDLVSQGEDGFLVPVFDDEKFSLRLQQLMKDEELRKRMGERARINIERFSLRSIGEAYLQVLLLNENCTD